MRKTALRSIVITLACLLQVGLAFSPAHSNRIVPSLALSMAPRFDKNEQKWIATSAAEQPEAGYPPIRTLLMHGPKPYVTRVFSPDEYEQGVLKFMAGDACTRDEAQGNMDAYLRNPNDWAVDRMYAQKKGIKMNYYTLNKQKVVLTAVWSVIVFSYAGFAINSLLNGREF